MHVPLVPQNAPYTISEFKEEKEKDNHTAFVAGAVQSGVHLFRLLVFIRSSVPLSISYTHYLFCVPRVLSANQVTILRHWIIFGKLNHCISLSEFPKCPSALNFILFYNIFLTHSVGKLTLSFSIFIKLINSLLF